MEESISLFPLCGKVNEPATAEVTHKVDGGQGDLSGGHGALPHSISPCWAWLQAQPLGKDLLGKDGLCLYMHLAHTPAQRANPEVFYPLYICLRKFKSKFGP